VRVACYTPGYERQPVIFSGTLLRVDGAQLGAILKLEYPLAAVRRALREPKFKLRLEYDRQNSSVGLRYELP